MRKMRARLATPEVIEEDQTMEILRRNGYAIDTAGNIEPCRGGQPVPNAYGPKPRWAHTHLAVVSILTSESSQRAALIAAVVAAVEEPGALVGTGKDGAVLVFRITADSYAFEARDGCSPQQATHEFALAGKPGIFTATADALAFDPAAYVWSNERSPLNTPRWALPPMHPAVSQSALDALRTFVVANGGRFGPVLPEGPIERMLRERAERKAAGVVDEPEETPEEAEARADERLVAAAPDLRPSDGVHGLRVSQARARIANRKRPEQAAKTSVEAAGNKAKLKALLEKSA
jgi:hypothetical protein